MTTTDEWNEDTELIYIGENIQKSNKTKQSENKTTIRVNVK